MKEQDALRADSLKMLSKALLLGSIAGLAAAQFPPPLTGVKTLKSKFHENVTISYKQVRFSLAFSWYIDIANSNA